MLEVGIEALTLVLPEKGGRGPVVKKYAELYLDARRALLPTEGQFASNVARGAHLRGLRQNGRAADLGPRPYASGGDL